MVIQKNVPVCRKQKYLGVIGQQLNSQMIHKKILFALYFQNFVIVSKFFVMCMQLEEK